MMPRTLLLLPLAAVALLVAACGGTPTPASTGASATPGGDAPGAGAPAAQASGTRTSEGGQVTVAATWGGPASGASFEVTLDTHSVDLDALDLSDAVLRNDRGETLAALPWPAPKGGHHRAGTLTFDGDQARFFAGARWVEMVLAGVGDLPERTLRWEIGS